MYATMIDYANATQTYLSGRGDSTRTLVEARASLTQGIAYIESVGRTVYHAHIDAFCDACAGTGRVPKKRGFARRTCPTCKGKDSTVRVETWIDRPWTRPESQQAA